MDQSAPYVAIPNNARQEQSSQIKYESEFQRLRKQKWNAFKMCALLLSDLAFSTILWIMYKHLKPTSSVDEPVFFWLVALSGFRIIVVLGGSWLAIKAGLYSVQSVSKGSNCGNLNSQGVQGDSPHYHQVSSPLERGEYNENRKNSTTDASLFAGNRFSPYLHRTIADPYFRARFRSAERQQQQQQQCSPDKARTILVSFPDSFRAPLLESHQQPSPCNTSVELKGNDSPTSVNRTAADCFRPDACDTQTSVSTTAGHPSSTIISNQPSIEAEEAALPKAEAEMEICRAAKRLENNARARLNFILGVMFLGLTASNFVCCVWLVRSSARFNDIFG